MSAHSCPVGAHSSFRERHGDVTVRKAEEVESLFSDAQVDVEGLGGFYTTDAVWFKVWTSIGQVTNDLDATTPT